jgi:N-carbamoyl-L-amino-acid hydrolase
VSVTAIVAIWQYAFTVTGEQNHRRHDVDDAAARLRALRWWRLLAAIDKRFPEICGPRTVWTTGRIALEPGQPQHHPGRGGLAVPAARCDPAVLDRLHAELFRLVDEAKSQRSLQS